MWLGSGTHRFRLEYSVKKMRFCEKLYLSSKAYLPQPIKTIWQRDFPPSWEIFASNNSNQFKIINIYTLFIFNSVYIMIISNRLLLILKNISQLGGKSLSHIVLVSSCKQGLWKIRFWWQIKFVANKVFTKRYFLSRIFFQFPECFFSRLFFLRMFFCLEYFSQNILFPEYSFSKISYPKTISVSNWSYDNTLTLTQSAHTLSAYGKCVKRQQILQVNTFSTCQRILCFEWFFGSLHL